MKAALVAVFKSKVLALVDQCHLAPAEVAGLGLTLAASHAVVAGITPAQLRAMLDQAIDETGGAGSSGAAA